jgi:hypothetical protein
LRVSRRRIDPQQFEESKERRFNAPTASLLRHDLVEYVITPRYSPDPKLVFLDNGKFSMEINLAEPVEPFCKTEYRLAVEVAAK